MKNRKFKIVASQSNIDWIGRKVTGPHNGTIGIREGTIVFEDDKITEGQLIIDTTSIKILDVSDPNTNAQLAGHLASDDFFASEQYPEALFVITDAEPAGNSGYNITGDLTIKEITHPVTFMASVSIGDNIVNAYGKIIVDRTLYGMKFRSGNFFQNLGDTLVYDEIELKVSIIAKATSEPVLSTNNLN